MKKTMQDDSIVVSMERSDTLQGSQRMISLGQGVKARLGKDKDGKSVVEAFLFDRDRYNTDKVDAWVAKHKDRIIESCHYVQMNAPSGSFEDTAMRVQAALDSSDTFAGFVRVEFVFPDKAVVTVLDNGDMYEVSYKDNGAEITFGTPAAVEAKLVQEKIESFKNRQERFLQPNTEIEGDLTKFKIKESVFNEADFQKTGDLVVVLIEAGTNFNKRRHYPKKTIQESSPLYAGLKMYLDHPTDDEESAKPERSIQDWLSTIKESWYEDGMTLGRVHIHHAWLKENMKDPVFRSEIGISINAAGRMHVAEIDGQQMQIMDAVYKPKSVDWVTEAGARGRVLQLLESQKIEKTEKEIMSMTIIEFKEKRKDLYDQIVAEVKESLKTEPLTEAQIKERVDKAVEKAVTEANTGVAKKERTEKRKAKAVEIVSGSKLPEGHRARFVESFMRENEEVADDKFEPNLRESIIGEIKHLNSLGLGKRIDVDAGTPAGATGAVAEAQAGILEAAGYSTKTEDKK